MELEPDLEISEDWFTEVGKAEDVIFYAMMIPEVTEAYLEGIAPAYQEEFKTLREELLEILKNGEYFEPVIQGADLIGKTLRFETTDVDGNPVKSEDIFKENDITMINIWATWCGNCVRELAELSEMNERLAEKNVAVIGICTDADTKLDACRALISENGVKYRNLLPFDGIEEALELTAYPTSYFVSSEGTILSLPFKGAPMEMSAYEEVINRLLADEEIAPEETSTQSANNAGVYRVIVADEEGKLIEGAVVQFCSDSTCTMGKTDENGVAEFKAEEGIYTIHILKVPAGYQKTSEEIQTDALYCDVYFVLKKA